MKKYILSTFLAICIAAMSILCISAQGQSEANNEDSSTAKEELFLEKQGKSLATYMAVKDQLEAEKDTFGGVYIDDNGDLNIVIAKSKQIALSEISEKSLLENFRGIVNKHREEDQNIIYHLAEYSLEHLLSARDKLMENSEKLGLVSASIDETRNIIIIGYLENAFEKTSVFELIDDNNMFVFQPCAGYDVAA